MDKEYTPAEAKAWLAGYDAGKAHASKGWVGLTDQDKKQIAMEVNNKSEMSAWEYAQRVGEFTEAKLKEKNI